MPHLNDKPGEHDLTVSGYVVYEQPGQPPKIWMHKHRKLGVWMQFGGHVERHQTPWQAVAMEVQQESGYLFSQLRILQPKVRIKELARVTLHPQPLALLTHDFPGLEHYHTDMPFAFVTSELPAGMPEDGESADLVAMTLDQIMALRSPAEIYDNVRSLCIFTLETVLPNYDRVETGQYA